MLEEEQREDGPPEEYNAPTQGEPEPDDERQLVTRHEARKIKERNSLVRKL